MRSPVASATVIAPASPSIPTIETDGFSVMPSAASSAVSRLASSGSSRGSNGPASITVTAAPSRRCAWANSMPTGPPPITTRCPGSTRLAKTVSLVKLGTVSMPGIGGTTGVEPVAITKRRGRISASPASTVRPSTKRASAAMTRTPSRSKRSAESLGASRAMTRSTLSATAAKSIRGGWYRTPNSAPRRQPSASLAAASSDFDGTQP